MSISWYTKRLVETKHLYAGDERMSSARSVTHAGVGEGHSPFAELHRDGRRRVDEVGGQAGGIGLILSV